MDTRTRIQEVALELFTEHGYEKTSLREVAERLGVTKAALYYHFKSKEEIVNSFVEDRISVMDELIRWAETQQPGVEMRRAVLRRYADDLFGKNRFPVMRFFEQNQTVLRSLPAGLQMRERLLRVAHLLAGPDQSAENEVRAALAIFAVHSSFFAMRPETSPQERHDVALKVAFELLDRIAEVEAESQKIDAGHR
ncbi:TetR/AcrR family transcriptional regulator [Micromonospora sp. CPCC 205371]|nr:TetR/AcrR family transcriptional regulator [Micromonospora sp. CPCC 205371]